MKTSEFIHFLKSYPGTQVHFEYAKGKYVRPDYHITEIKNISFDTVDCGGIQNKWNETHVQLWEPEIPETDHSVDATKTLKIFEAVNKVRPTFQDTEIKFEYGNSHFSTSVLPVSDILIDTSKIIVQLIPDHTSCKAKDRAHSDEERARACCGNIAKQNIALTNKKKESFAADSGCC